MSDCYMLWGHGDDVEAKLDVLLLHIHVLCQYLKNIKLAERVFLYRNCSNLK
jgi:hypothetical protein